MTEVRRFAHGSRVPGWDDAVDLAKDPSPVPDRATTTVPAQLRATIEDYMAKYPDRRSAVIPALAAAQRHHGWCSPEAIEQAATVLELTPGYLAAIATFYDMLETEPKPAHDVYVCTNISCSLRGGDAIHEAMVAAVGDDPSFNVRSFECLGACDIAPMASVDGVYVGPLEAADVDRIVDDVRLERPVLEAKQLTRRPAADPDANQGDFEVKPAAVEARAEPGATIPVADPERTAVGPPMAEPSGGGQPAPDHGEHDEFDPPPRPERREGS